MKLKLQQNLFRNLVEQGRLLDDGDPALLDDRGQRGREARSGLREDEPLRQPLDQDGQSIRLVVDNLVLKKNSKKMLP